MTTPRARRASVGLSLAGLAVLAAGCYAPKIMPGQFQCAKGSDPPCPTGFSCCAGACYPPGATQCGGDLGAADGGGRDAGGTTGPATPYLMVISTMDGPLYFGVSADRELSLRPKDAASGVRLKIFALSLFGGHPACGAMYSADVDASLGIAGLTVAAPVTLGLCEDANPTAALKGKPGTVTLSFVTPIKPAENAVFCGYLADGSNLNGGGIGTSPWVLRNWTAGVSESTECTLSP